MPALGIATGRGQDPPMRLLLLTLLSVVLLPAARAATSDVTIYRCAAADGTVALRDSPCLDGETQQVRNMTRPQDPPPQAAPQVAQQQPYQQYQIPPASAYDGVSSSGGTLSVRTG